MSDIQPAGNTGLAAEFQAMLSNVRERDVNTMSLKLANMILRHAILLGASDIHFDPKHETTILRFRIDGLLKDQLTYPKNTLPIVAALRVAAGFPPKAAVAYTPEDGRFEFIIDGRSVQFRVSSFPSILGDKLVLRLLDLHKTAPSLGHLGFSAPQLAQINKITRQPSGLFIVSGMTGCGKSTTLNCILGELSRPELNIMTLEDPVEYVLPRVTHAQINYRAGFGFAEGLRCILRQDPNIILLGEIRDAETAETAIRAALTGHLLLSTVHAPSSVGVIHRLKCMNVEPFLLASSLLGVMSQRLVRLLCPACSEAAGPDPDFIKSLETVRDPAQSHRALSLLKQQGGNFRKAKGCPACGMTGYKGRTVVSELLPIGDTLRSVISGKETDIVELKKAAEKSGMQPLLCDALGKAAQGLTSLEEVSRVVSES